MTKERQGGKENFQESQTGGRTDGGEGFPCRLWACVERAQGKGCHEELLYLKNHKSVGETPEEHLFFLQSFAIRLHSAVSEEDVTTLSLIFDCDELSAHTASPYDRQALCHSIITTVMPTNATVPFIP